MADSARDHLALLLAAHDELPASVQLRPRPPGAVRLQVDGVGEVALPVSAAQARALRDVARPARFGRGEQTLTDSAVRDTWEVPRDAVHVDWADAADLAGALDSVRDNLGLPDGCRLTAELHSLLVYETGQFFLPHQDSEKSDAMVATLVVTLPSQHSGGELVVHHLGEATTYRGSPGEVSLVAFYADCRHEVRPVTSGHRVTLTYNLLLTGVPVDRVPDDVVLGQAADHLRTHFRTPIETRYSRRVGEQPHRLVFLLDHEYTERGLAWDRLKGTDTSRAALLRAGAEVADCEAVLALAEIQEIWDAEDPDDDHDGRWRSSWHDEDDDPDDDPADDDSDDAPDDTDSYVLNSLIDSTMRLTWWTDTDGTSAEDISLLISADEACSATPSSALTPYASQYEGYMGNYGNTLDRWYRRAAVVVSPRHLGFVQRAEASPGWALRDLAGRASDPLAAHRDATTLAPFWAAAVRSLDRSEQLLGTALAVADLVADPDLATMLLRPFALESLDPRHAAALTTLTDRYGPTWTTSLLTDWLEPAPRTPVPAPGRRSRQGWLSTLPDLVAALGQLPDPAAVPTADAPADPGRKAIQQLLEEAGHGWTPSSRAAGLQRLGPVLGAVITAAGSVGSPGPLDAIVTSCRTDGDRLEPCLRALLLGGPPATASPRVTEALTLLAADQVNRVRARLAVPAREPDDWSMALPAGCSCELCATLGGFLAAPTRTTFEWPLAKDSRSHVHSRIDGAELPVRHQTRRTGRPYTLVLTKTSQLFEDDSTRRNADLADLAALTDRWPTALS